MSAKYTSFFFSLWLLTLTFFYKDWMWSTTSLLSLQLSIMHWMHIVSFFLSFLPCDFLFCCNYWSVFLPFLIPCGFRCCFIIIVDNCSNNSCCNCWSIFPTFLYPCNFLCWFVVASYGCYKISLIVVVTSYDNCWNIVPIQMSIVSTEIETHLIITPLHQPTRWIFKLNPLNLAIFFFWTPCVLHYLFHVHAFLQTQINLHAMPLTCFSFFAFYRLGVRL